MSDDTPWSDRLRDGFYREVHDALITGTAIIIPFVITLIILSFVLGFIYRRLNVFSDLLLQVPGVSDVTTEFLINLLAPVVLVAAILVVGAVANRSQSGERAVDYFDYVIGNIPGVGSIYDSFRQMSDVVLESDVENFRDVKLLEFPNDGLYTLGFLTTRTPQSIRETASDDEMVTLFLPLAPNPVMGGHLVHVHPDRVLDVEMSVEDAMSTIVTTGVGTAGSTGTEGLDREELERLTGTGALGPNPGRTAEEE